MILDRRQIGGTRLWHRRQSINSNSHQAIDFTTVSDYLPEVEAAADSGEHDPGPAMIQAVILLLRELPIAVEVPERVLRVGRWAR